MKTSTICIALLLFSCLSGIGQTKKGNRELSAYGYFNYYSDRDTKNSGLLAMLNPSVGHFFADNFVAGVGIYYQFSKYKSSSERDFYHYAGFNTYARYYIPIRERIKVPLELSFGYRHQWSIYTSASNQSSSGRAMARTGLEYFIDPTLSIGITGGYVLPVIDSDGSDRGQAVANIGFGIYFERDREIESVE